eukprot:4832959-Pleurochrysis_carterae.AAC.2
MGTDPEYYHRLEIGMAHAVYLFLQPSRLKDLAVRTHERISRPLAHMWQTEHSTQTGLTTATGHRSGSKLICLSLHMLNMPQRTQQATK